MDIKQGYVYHIKDEYFEIAKDDKLMQNKENGAYRPTYLCVKDEKSPILWMVPMSSRVEKYERIIKAKTQKYGESLGIIIGEFNGKKSAFLLQNMFPIIEKYLSHIHTKNNVPVPVSVSLQSQIATNMKRIKRLNARGKKVVFTDISRLEALMITEMRDTNKKIGNSFEIVSKKLDKLNESYAILNANPYLKQRYSQLAAEYEKKNGVSVYDTSLDVPKRFDIHNEIIVSDLKFKAAYIKARDEFRSQQAIKQTPQPARKPSSPKHGKR